MIGRPALIQELIDFISISHGLFENCEGPELGSPPEESVDFHVDLQ